MSSLPNLNRRHKAILFVTLLVAGASLFVDASTKNVLGVVVLGAALAWAGGSNQRALHWLIMASGVLWIAGVMWWEWDSRLSEFEAQIPALSRKHPLIPTTSAGERPSSTGDIIVRTGVLHADRGLQMTREELAAALKSLYPEYHDWPDDWLADQFIAKYSGWKRVVLPRGSATPTRPKWMTAALRGGVDTAGLARTETPRRPVKAEELLPLIPGSTLWLLGLGLLCFDRPRGTA